jgi:hypothetical protein
LFKNKKCFLNPSIFIDGFKKQKYKELLMHFYLKMSSVGEPPKVLHLSLMNYVREIDKECVAFCPIGLSDPQIVDFSSKNRNKKLRFSCRNFNISLKMLYKNRTDDVISFVSGLCLIEQKEISESMTLIDVLDLVHQNDNMFFSKVLYRIYKQTKSCSYGAVYTIETTIRDMALEFVAKCKENKGEHHDPQIEMEEGSQNAIISLFEKEIYRRPDDWFSSKSK